MLIIVLVELVIILTLLSLLLKPRKSNTVGDIVIHETDDKKTISIEPTIDPDEFEKRKQVAFNIMFESR